MKFGSSFLLRSVCFIVVLTGESLSLIDSGILFFTQSNPTKFILVIDAYSYQLSLRLTAILTKLVFIQAGFSYQSLVEIRRVTV